MVDAFLLGQWEALPPLVEVAQPRVDLVVIHSTWGRDEWRGLVNALSHQLNLYLNFLYFVEVCDSTFIQHLSPAYQVLWIELSFADASGERCGTTDWRVLFWKVQLWYRFCSLLNANDDANAHMFSRWNVYHVHHVILTCWHVDVCQIVLNTQRSWGWWECYVGLKEKLRDHQSYSKLS